ncbi:MAG TPA: hypothetical protein VEX68_23395 [Bryobacteraceae bacterium]|nr:hypothetical protein [Bryobacteraceae bacterium]
MKRAITDKAVKTKREKIDVDNLRAALVIIADADRYGEDGLAVRWARLVLSR